MKRIRYILLALLLLLPFSTKASTNTYERSKYDNLGVNKHWKITEKNRGNVLNTYMVDSKEKIYDFSEVITEEDEKEIYNSLIELGSYINMDVAFVTVNLPYSDDKENEDYAADFYDYNDFGIDKENYSGILLFRNTYEADPYYNVYLFGNAQLYFDYERCENMLNDIYDSFHSGNYKDGILTFVKDFKGNFYNGIASSKKNYIINKFGNLEKIYVTPYVTIIFVSSIITLITILVLVKKNKLVKKKLETQNYVDKSGINLTIIKDNLVRTFVTHHTRESSSGSSFGGHSSSGSSGGGHSSGGGRHG